MNFWTSLSWQAASQSLSPHWTCCVIITCTHYSRLLWCNLPSSLCGKWGLIYVASKRQPEHFYRKSALLNCWETFASLCAMLLFFLQKCQTGQEHASMSILSEDISILLKPNCRSLKKSYDKKIAALTEILTYSSYLHITGRGPNPSEESQFRVYRSIPEA